MTFECTVTVFEGAGTNETINTTQLTVTLREQSLSLTVPPLTINYDTLIVGGWSHAKLFNKHVEPYLVFQFEIILPCTFGLTQLMIYALLTSPSMLYMETTLGRPLEVEVITL